MRRRGKTGKTAESAGVKDFTSRGSGAEEGPAKEEQSGERRGRAASEEGQTLRPVFRPRSPSDSLAFRFQVPDSLNLFAPRRKNQFRAMSIRFPSWKY